MAPVDVWMWLETLPISAYIGETWWFPLLESIHVVGATFLVGSILMVDLRLLGLATRNHPLSRITAEVLPWTRAAFVLSVIAGIGMFVTRASHYAENVAFQVKLVLLLFAGLNMAVFHFWTSPEYGPRDSDATLGAAARVAGAASLILWIGVMLAGRWVGHLI